MIVGRLGIAFSALLFGIACGPAGDDSTDLNNLGNNGSVEVIEREGIASDDFVDLLHYYLSTQEDGPGLYAYRPATPDEAPVLVDPNVTIQNPFNVTFPIAETEGGNTLHLRPKGVFYNAGATFPPVAGEIPSVKSYLVTTDPSQLDSEPQQVSNHDYPGSFIGSSAYLAFGDSLSTSSIWLSILNMRIDLNMTADEAPLTLPEDGGFLASMLGEGSQTHDHWLYIDADGSLKFYDTQFATSTPVNDEDSGMPIVNLKTRGSFITYLGVDNALVLLMDADADTQNGEFGQVYRVTRPGVAGPGVAKLLTNADGEPIEFGMPGSILGRTIPGEAARWNDTEAFYFSEGPSIFSSDIPAQLTRVTADGWTALQIELDDFAAFSAPIFVRVDGGFFWAPGYKPELIYPDGNDPSSWVRTPLDAPQPNESTIFSSAGDWVYYQSADDAAVALNVKTGDTLELANSLWIGASFVSDVGEEIRTGLIARQDLATVLVHLADNRLGAVEAARPQDGIVILGELPETTDEVIVSGPAIGPARLVRLKHEDGSVEVIAIDTRQAGSLRHIMESPAQQWAYESDIAGTPIEIDVPPETTGPLSMF